jgi:hypothetical protein
MGLQHILFSLHVFFFEDVKVFAYLLFFKAYAGINGTKM